MRNLILSFLILLSSNLVFAESNPIFNYRQFSLKEGLTQATVRTVLRDSDGFLWIGTSLGLNRFDGQNLTTYLHSNDTPNGLPGNYIYYVAEDEQKNTWVSANDKLTLFDKEKQEFIIQRINGSPFASHAYCLVPDGMICCSSGALFKYVYESRSWQRMPIKTKNRLPFHFTAVKPWDDNHLLLNTRFNGLYLYQLSSGAVTEFPFFKEKNIPSIFIDSKKQLWISSYRKGLYCYSQTGELIKKYSTQNSLLSNDVILTITEHNGNLWLGTDGGGINILNPNSGTFTQISHVFENPNSFPATSILSLYRDNWGSFWVGTVRNGLIEIKEVSMKTYKQVTMGNHYGLSNQTVLSLFQDDDQTIWIGTDGGGINKLHPATGEFKHFSTTINDKVTSIARHSKDELLISIFDKGVYFFNKKTGKKRPFLIIDDETNTYITTSGYSTTLFSSDGVITEIYSDNIYLYNNISKSFSIVSFRKEENSPREILNPVSSDHEVQYIHSFNKIFQKKSDSYDLLYAQPDNSDLINAVAKDKEGKLWIATNKGIRRFNPDTRHLEEYLQTPSQSIITSLVCDSQNRLWIGTRADLWSYYINEERFEIFNEPDGAASNEYLRGATLITKSGDIYMGGVDGLLFIDKNTVFEDKPIPEVELIEVSTKNKEMFQFDAALDNAAIPQINLSWNESSITLRVIVKEKEVFRKRHFRYYVSGLYRDTIETDNQFLTLHSLSSGAYTIWLSHNLPNGAWSKPKNILNLNVAPPWWKSIWFTLLMAVLILMLVTLAFLYFINKKESALKWKLQAREKEIQGEKVRFLINISHELRTPLTLIYAPLKRMLKRPLDSELHSQINNIYKQAARMKETINMVLDLHKIETGNEKLIINEHKLNDWLRETVNLFSNEFDYLNTEVHFSLDERIDFVSFDKNKCEIVLSNILSNALKFGSKNSSINVSTALNKQENKVRVSISDEGRGLSDADSEKLFTRFYQGNHQQGGSGIGLSFSKTLIERHGGTMGAFNNENGKGATFYFELPLFTLANAEQKTQSLISNVQIADYTDIARDTESQRINTTAYSILLVEDNPELLDFLKQSFKHYFKHVYSCTNGITALEIAHRDMPDIIVSDVVMPQMDGFELCRKVKSDISISHIPIILLTARGDTESMQIGYKLGADAYVSKPFDIDFLHAVIESQLRMRELIKTRYQEHDSSLSLQDITFSNADERFVMRLNDIIEENISNPSLSVNFISTEIGMSRTSLYSKMNELLNVGVNDYINRIKFDKAATLLTLEPYLEIAEIASRLGFSSQRYFSTSFKQYKGVSPSEYRKRKN